MWIFMAMGPIRRKLKWKRRRYLLNRKMKHFYHNVQQNSIRAFA